MDDRYQAHQRIYLSMHPFFRAVFRMKFRLRYDAPPELPDHFLLIGNHVTNYDPFLVGIALRRQMYYVATEHIFRLGLRTKLIRYLVDPIPLTKGGNTSTAVLEILRRLRAGKSVCLFAEGNCTWDGRTGEFPEATGKMVLKSKAPLITCRITGGYFARPRWAVSDRKGPLRVELIHIYPPEELSSMKPDEVDRHIAEDIREDAYARQLAEPQPYTGRRLSKGIENVLLFCPKCGSFGSLVSTSRGFSCSCGLSGRYDRYGMLQGDGFDFTTIRDWEDWQRAYLDKLPSPSEKETVYTSDEGLVLYQVAGHRKTALAAGTLSGSDHGLHLENFDFPFSRMADLAVRLQGTVTFSMTDGSYYELKKAAKGYYSGRKYLFLFNRFAREAKLTPDS